MKSPWRIIIMILVVLILFWLFYFRIPATSGFELSMLKTAEV
jgi:hypothetical protein